MDRRKFGCGICVSAMIGFVMGLTGSASAQTPPEAPNAAAVTVPPASTQQQITGRLPQGSGVRPGQPPLPGEVLPPSAPAPQTARTPQQQRMAAERASDSRFLARATQDAALQYELGLVQAARGTNNTLKQYAMHSAQGFNHAKANLEALASEYQLAIPTLPLRPIPDLRQWLDGVPQRQVDRDYLARIIPAIQGDLKTFTNEAHAGTNPALKQYAQNVVPWLQQRQQLAAALLQGTGRGGQCGAANAHATDASIRMIFNRRAFCAKPGRLRRKTLWEEAAAELRGPLSSSPQHCVLRRHSRAGTAR